MSWVRFAVRAAFAGAIGLAIPNVAAAQSVVVRSTGPSAAQFPAGKRLAANAPVTLRAGDHVTVLDRSGTRVLNGPGAFTLDASVAHDQTAATRIAGLITRGAAPRTRTGAVRGAPDAAPAGPARPESVWYIDTTRGGTWCVADPKALVLWRPNRAGDVTATLSAARGTSASVAWRSGSALKLWPAAMPVSDGATYTLTGAGSGAGSRTVFITRILPALPEGDFAATAGMLADAGCTAQLELLAG